jgi:hypothetical protein
LKLRVDLTLGGLSVLSSGSLEGIDGGEDLGDIVGGGLEFLVRGLNLVDHSLVIEETAVVREVDLLGSVLEGSNLAAGILVALLEGLQLSRRLAFQAQGGGDTGPIDFEGSASLLIESIVVRERRDRRWSGKQVLTAGADMMGMI